MQRNVIKVKDRLGAAGAVYPIDISHYAGIADCGKWHKHLGPAIRLSSHGEGGIRAVDNNFKVLIPRTPPMDPEAQQIIAGQHDRVSRVQVYETYIGE